jgi:hypothetical protein
MDRLFNKVMTTDLIFCSTLFPGSETDSLLLAESIRHFGGTFANQPIWFLQPQPDQPLSGAVAKRLRALDVRLLPFPYPKDAPNFFFHKTLTGLAHGEALDAAETDCLVWMDSNTVVVNEPKELFLPEGVVLGYRPVQHLLVGSQYNKPLDPFWGEIYKTCNVPPERVFPMRLVVQDVDARPYFNAGFMVLRPQSGLVQKWYNTFIDLFQSPAFLPFYEQDKRYEVFMHQAVLAGVVLSSFERSQLRELPRGYNYPMDLHNIDHTTFRPGSMDEVVTFRHEGCFEAKDWREHFPASNELIQWIESKLQQVR